MKVSLRFWELQIFLPLPPLHRIGLHVHRRGRWLAFDTGACIRDPSGSGMFYHFWFRKRQWTSFGR